MISTKLPIILTDIEGTTSSISFVKQTLFPYASQHLAQYLELHKNDSELRPWLEQLSKELKQTTFDLPSIVSTLLEWIRVDRKHTALKAIQGMIWRSGYEHCHYQAHIYSDAKNQLHHWHHAGHPIYVYSSGSVEAQRLFFKYSSAGDLSAMFSGHYDTQIGHKRDSASYSRISEEIGTEPEQIIFLSDIVEELDAARDAGMQTVLIDRIEDYPTKRIGTVCNGHQRVESFQQIEL